MYRLVLLIFSLMVVPTQAFSQLRVPRGYNNCEDFQMFPFPQTYAGPKSTIGRFDVDHAMFNGAPQEITLSDRTEDRDGTSPNYDWRANFYISGTLFRKITNRCYCRVTALRYSIS